MQMEVQILVSGDNPIEEVPSLWRWLDRQRDLSGRVQGVRRPVDDGELGAGLDTLIIALGSGTGAALARSLNTWLQTRRSNVAITVKTPTGSTTVTAGNLDPNEVQALLQGVLHEHDPSDAPPA
jgi:Effector Associated Constant Component 1